MDGPRSGRIGDEMIRLLSHWLNLMSRVGQNLSLLMYYFWLTNLRLVMSVDCYYFGGIWCQAVRVRKRTMTHRRRLAVSLTSFLLAGALASSAQAAAEPTPVPSGPASTPQAPAGPGAHSSVSPCPRSLGTDNQPLTASPQLSPSLLHGTATICVRPIHNPRASAAIRNVGPSTRAKRAKTLESATPADEGSVPSPFPQWCAGNGPVYTLTDVCQIESYELDIVNDDTGVLVGTLDYNAIEYAYWETGLLDMIYEISLDPYHSSGVGNDGWTTVQNSGYCAIHGGGGPGISCTVTDYEFPQGATFYAPPGWPQTTDTIDGYSQIDTSYASGTEARVWIASPWGFYYGGSVPIRGSRYVYGEYQYLVYCDNNFPGSSTGGCKAPTDLYTPTLTYSLTTYPTLAQAIQDAQAAGVPGSSTSGAPLFRATSTSIQNSNRNVACNSSWTRPPGDECDEYPFASTYEGAAYNPSSGITFSYCNNPNVPQTTSNPKWESCFVPASENSSAGGVLSNFLTANRTLDDDRYYVNVVP